MGRTPDYKAAFGCALGANPAFYGQFEQNARNWYTRIQETGLNFNHAIVNPPIDRHKPADEVKDVYIKLEKETDAGMTGMAMEERFKLTCWQKGGLAQPVLNEALASLEGEISQVQTIGTHLVYLVAIKHIHLSEDGHGLIYFKRRFHPVLIEQEVTI